MPGPIVEAPPKNDKSKGSPNKGMIDSLVSTLQRNEILVPDDKVNKLGLQWKPAKLYDSIRKMNQDLNKAYDALFDGPLPPVDGYYLTRLNAAVLNGIIPASYNLAYTNINNDFNHGQRIIWDDDQEPFLQMGFGDLMGLNTTFGVTIPGSYFRIGSEVDGEFFISQNLFVGDTGLERDDVTTGASRINFLQGDIVFNWYDDILTDMRRTFTVRGREIKIGNWDQSVDFSLFYVTDTNDVVRFCTDATADGTGVPAFWPAFPQAVTANLPTAGAIADGVFGIDKTLHALVFYVNGLRYRVVGTSF